MRPALALLPLLVLTSPMWAEDPPLPDFPREIAPLLQKHCQGCHGEQQAKGELRLHGFRDEAAVRADRETWQNVLAMLEGELMPPKEAPQLPAADRAKLVRWVEATLFHVDCSLERNPGRVTIRRLNRAEYNNTVRDLLGVDLHPADAFPSDDVGNGFDNMGDVLTIPPLLLERYLEAAEQLAEAAIVAPETRALSATRKQGRELSTQGGRRDGEVYALVSTGDVGGEFEVAKAGRYFVRLHAGGDQAGPEPVKAAVAVDKRPLETVSVTATRDEPKTYELEVELSAGRHEIVVRFINDYYQPNAEDPKLRGDRNLFVHWLEVAGPRGLDEDALPESHRRIVRSRPRGRRSAAVQAASECLKPVIQRAFRRPVTDEELRPYLELVRSATERGDSFERGLQVALTAALVSPHFLFRVELDGPRDGATRPLTDFELAARLSYFLWSTLPDDELFASAGRGELSKPEVLREQVRRMLADPRSAALGENFAAQWLNLRNLDLATPDPRKFPEFDARLRDDMRRETLLFFDSFLREDRSVVDFVLAGDSFLNERLARHYGVEGVQGEEFRKVALPERRRAGVLGQASVLTITSNPGRTSPVKRGKWILENLLGTPPPAPPPNVPQLDEAQKAAPTATLREQLELHRKDPNCAVCHDQMDALGFGLENFDPVGRWRDQDGPAPIDASGVLPSGDQFAGPVELAAILSKRREQIARCVTEKLLTFALGRGLEYYDRCAVDKIMEVTAAQDHRLPAVVMAIVESEPFRLRRDQESGNE